MLSTGRRNTRNFSRPGPYFGNASLRGGEHKPSTGVSRGRVAATSKEDPAKQSRRRRVGAYYTHAIVTFHTFGIPLSAGLTLEYYFNSVFVTTQLEYLTLIFGVQWAGTWSMELLAASAYRWKHYRWIYFAVSLVVVLCHVVMARNTGIKSWGLSMGMRALVGICLGFLRSLTLRCLASHYQGDIVQVSMQSGAAAMVGALAYSLVAWGFLRVDNYRGLAWANFYIVLFTLVPTLAGLNHAATCTDAKEVSETRRSVPRLRHRKSAQTAQNQQEIQATQTNTTLAAIGNVCFLGGYFLIYAFAYVWPTFFPLLLSSRPMREYPEDAAVWLFGTFGAGTFTASFFAYPWPRRGLGAVNTLIGAAIFAGCFLVIAAWIPNAWLWGIASVMYGLALGPLLALQAKVLGLLSQYWAKRRYLPMGLGLCAFGGISVAGVMIQSLGGGAVALTVSGGFMVVGGFCMAVGRWLKYPTRYVVI